jgi:hypothetical protein
MKYLFRVYSKLSILLLSNISAITNLDELFYSNKFDIESKAISKLAKQWSDSIHRIKSNFSSSIDCFNDPWHSMSPYKNLRLSISENLYCAKFTD